MKSTTFYSAVAAILCFAVFCVLSVWGIITRVLNGVSWTASGPNISWFGSWQNTCILVAVCFLVGCLIAIIGVRQLLGFLKKKTATS